MLAIGRPPPPVPDHQQHDPDGLDQQEHAEKQRNLAEHGGNI
jgi:hypothetical protein